MTDAQESEEEPQKHFPDRIVYVDDDQDMRNLLRACLQRSDYKFVLVTCGSGKELLSRQRELQPELIILDLLMPDMNGLDVIEKLRETEEGIQIPIILLTGKDKVTMHDEYHQINVLGVIHKPFDIKLFPDLVADMWTRHCKEVEEKAKG